MATVNQANTTNRSTNYADNHGAAMEQAIAFVKKGSKLTKVRSKLSKNERHFLVEQDESILTYLGSKKCSKKKRSNRIYLSDIQEIRPGSGSDAFLIAYGSKSHLPPFKRLERQYGLPRTTWVKVIEKDLMAVNMGFNTAWRKYQDKDSRCFSLVIGEEGEMLDLVAPTEEERQLWITGIEECHKRIRMKSTSAAEVFQLWVKQLFHEADKDSNGQLNVKETTRILNLMNLNMDEEEAAQHMKKKSLNFDEFGRFIMSIIKKEEIETELFKKYGRSQQYDNGQQYWTKNELYQFLTQEQGENIKMEQCEKIIQENETCPDFKKNHWLGLAGFTAFLDTDRMNIKDPKCCQVYHDMKQPLSHYFIDSSHNTYLESDQLKGYSKLECYIRALKSGCRCVEMDVWDGTDLNPVVTHGFTLTSKILFSEVIRVVDKYAFCKSKYPLILSIENHCSVEQQKIMARTMKSVFREKLFLDELVPKSNYLPSPSDLMEKIIIKCKKNSQKLTKAEDKRKVASRVHSNAAVETAAHSTISAADDDAGQDSDDDDEDAVDGEEETEIAEEFSDCINICQTARFKSFQDSKENQTFRMILSFSEKKAMKLVKSAPADFIQHNKRQLSRIFPAGSRIGSTNYNPVPFWLVGCQVLALNYQTPDEPMQLNRGFFGDNGGCGYILKPDFMRSFTSKATFSPDGFHPSKWHKTLKFRILSGFCLPKKEGDSSKSILDPYVQVSITGVPRDRKTARTEVVSNNGFHPSWETCNFEFFISCPELALLHLQVFDHETKQSDVVIAQYCLPVRCIQKGYRTVHLKTVGGELIPSAKLYVHVLIS